MKLLERINRRLGHGPAPKHARTNAVDHQDVHAEWPAGDDGLFGESSAHKDELDTWYRMRMDR